MRIAHYKISASLNPDRSSIYGKAATTSLHSPPICVLTKLAAVSDNRNSP
jgi:hypothetical protein